MIPPSEIKAWEMQICEGNYAPGPEGTIIPQSGTLLPRFVKMAYDELTLEQNYDVSHPNNIFAKAAAKGPIAIIMDECMENLGGHKGVSKFFHAFPSKLHDKFPKCTGYTVLVVLHNMNPRRDLGGNIANLKIQAKMHLISPRMHPSQLNRFVNTFTKGLPLAISLLLKDIFQFHAQKPCYDWIIYNTTPEHDALQWSYLHPRDGLMPMYLNIQAHLYRVLENIHKVLNDRDRWSRAYRKRNKKTLLTFQTGVSFIYLRSISGRVKQGHFGKQILQLLRQLLQAGQHHRQGIFFPQRPRRSQLIVKSKISCHTTSSRGSGRSGSSRSGVHRRSNSGIGKGC